MLSKTKPFTITTDAVNSFGFRVLTAGIDLSNYFNNPILLWMHSRLTSDKNGILPIGRLQDIEVLADKIIGTPYLDLADDFAVKILDKVNFGIINMTSAGLQPIEASDAPELMLPGQTGPTVTKSILKEVSLVDIGSNPQACSVVLFDQSGCKIEDEKGLLKLMQKPGNKPFSPSIATTASVITQPVTTSKSLPFDGKKMTAAYALLNLSFQTGKISDAEREQLFEMIIKDNQYAAVSNLLLNFEIKPALLDDRTKKYGGHYLPLSFDQIEAKVPGGAALLKREFPDLYQMKFAEKFRRLPAVM